MDPNEQVHEDALQTGDSSDNDQPSSAFDLLQEINETQGEGLNKPSAEASSESNDNNGAEPNSGTDAGTTEKKPAEPAKPAATTVSTKTLSPEDDPEFVKDKTSDKQPEGEQKPTGTSQDSAQAGKGDQAENPVVFDRLSELTDGAIKSEEDFNLFVERYNELATQAQEGFKPKFRNEAHKRAFDLLANVPEGQELDTVRRIHHALSIDTSKLKGRDLLFEGFLLDPENADLTRDQAAELFDAYFEKMYGSADSDLLVKRELEKAERKAKETIEKTQGEFAKPAQVDVDEPGTPPEVVSNVKKAIGEFGGLVLSFSENAADNELLRIKAEPKEIQTLERYMMNPQEFWGDLMKIHRDDKGNFDYKGFTNTLYEFANIQKIKKETFNHGIAVGQLKQFNKDRNSSDTADVTKQKGRVPAGVKKEAGSFYEAFEGALQGRS